MTDERRTEIATKVFKNPRPIIKKLGTIHARKLTETTPLVYKGELLRFEVCRPGRFLIEKDLAGGPVDARACLRFVNVRTGQPTPRFAFDHIFGFAMVIDDMMYVVSDKGTEWGSDTLTFYRSKDLVNWEEYTELHIPGFKVHNMNIAKMGDTYTLLVETSAPIDRTVQKPFIFRFLQSKDMINWTLLPEEYMFQKARYSGAPAIYTLEGDPHYYVCYLEAYPHECYATCIARSTDLINWEYSLRNPVLMFDEVEDKKIANQNLSDEDRERIAKAIDINNSDMEICEFNGRVVIYYMWGNQINYDFLAEAYYEGTMKDFLLGFFE